MDTLPDEIKLIIISYIPCYKFITKDACNILPIFDKYIKDYINNKLLTDNYCNGRLYNSKLYKKIIETKLKDITLSITKKFMEHSNGIVWLNFDNPAPIYSINLIIIFTFTKVGNYFSGSIDDVKFQLSNTNYFDYSNICNITFYGKSTYINYNENDIQNKLYNVLIRNMDLSDTTIDIKKMELIKTIYPNGFINYNQSYDELLIKYI